MKILSLTGLAFMLTSPYAFAATYKVEVQNLTHGSYFTPLLIAAHPSAAKLFSAGAVASSHLQKMAEGGSIAELDADILSAGGKTMANPAGGLLAPGASTMAMLPWLDATQTQLSVVAMILPSNDGFIGLNNMTLPTLPGTYTYMVNAYDAGTEANDEIRGGGAPGVAGMPVPPPLEAKVGTGGTGIPTSAEGFVHIHRGTLGDHMATGGMSDINASSQRWLNPVARVTVTVE